MTPHRERICIAIMALGGQGGGVLADWIQAVARNAGWLAQGTSVPGVAQRTGSTVYYVEFAKRRGGKAPVMALMPVPGDVDIVIASELMEAGRSMLRGFCTGDRTLLIGSTHRIYAISEKSAMGDGRGDSAAVIKAAESHARRFIGFDMEETALRAGSLISAVLLGALAASDALPFERALFEDAIRSGGVAVESNLRGFAAGFEAARRSDSAQSAEEAARLPEPTTADGRRLRDRIVAELPVQLRAYAMLGVQRLMDFQDARYAELFLERLGDVVKLDRPPFLLSSETARGLALWMAYDDAIRVADLKTRAARRARVANEVQAGRGQILGVTEFLHPRPQEICDILPARFGQWLRSGNWLSTRLEGLLQSGRHVETTSLRWFLAMRFLAGLQRFRPKSLRYQEEQQRIVAWLRKILEMAPANADLALELARCQGLIKGYGDTFDRGWRNFVSVTEAAMRLGPADPTAGARLARLRELALQDEKGSALLAELEAQ